MSDKQHTRRDFIKTTAYVAPLILTLPAIPAFASSGSGSSGGGSSSSSSGGRSKHDGCGGNFWCWLVDLFS